jgi:zinc protease
VRLHLVVSSLLFVLAACAGFQTYRLTSLDFPNKSGKLANGLRVVIQPDDSHPTVLTTLRYEVGAAHDPQGKRGLAHLIEHLAFRLGDEIVTTPARASATVDVGAAPADAPAPKPVKSRKIHYLLTQNADTNVDSTFYWKRVVPAHLDDALKSLAEQMSDFSPKISDDVLAAEREVVRNERRARYEDGPLDRFWIDFYERFYPAGHPYQGPAVIGSHDSLTAVTRDDIATFLRAHYHPGNATLTVVGPVDAAAVLAKVMTLFGNKAARQPSTLTKLAWKPTYREETVVVSEAKNTLVTVAWPLAPTLSDEALALETLGEHSWFWWRLVHNRGWSYWVWSGVIEQELESMFVVQTLLRDHDDVDSVRNKILEIASLAGSTVSGDDFKGTRRRFSYRQMFDAEDREDRARFMSRSFNKSGTPIAWAALFDRYEKLELESVRSMGGRLLDKDRAFVLVHTPVKPEERGQKHAEAVVASVTADGAKAGGNLDSSHEVRSTLPEEYHFTQPAAEFSSWALAAADRAVVADEFTLANGLRCRVRQDGLLPILSAAVVFKGGQLAEPKDRHGVADLLLSNLGISGRAYGENFWYSGGIYRYMVNDEFLMVSEEYPSFYADTALLLLKERLSNPNVTQQAVADDRAEKLQAIRGAASDVSDLAYRAYWRLRGLEDLSPVSTSMSVERAGYSEVRDYHDAVFYPENAVLSVVSNLPTNEVRALVEAHFAGWASAERQAIDVRARPSPKPASAAVGYIDVPDAPQSQLWVGFDAPGWVDWKALVLTDAIAILLDEKAKHLREAYGATYGVSSDVDNWAPLGLLSLSSKVDRKATTDGVRQLLRAVDDLKHQRISDGELERARRDLMLEYAAQGDSNYAKARTAAFRMAKGLPASHSADVVRYLSSITVADLQAATDHMFAQPAVVVVAGAEPEFAKIPALKALPVTRYRPEDLL